MTVYVLVLVGFFLNGGKPDMASAIFPDAASCHEAMVASLNNAINIGFAHGSDMSGQCIAVKRPVQL